MLAMPLSRMRVQSVCTRTDTECQLLLKLDSTLKPLFVGQISILTPLKRVQVSVSRFTGQNPAYRSTPRHHPVFLRAHGPQKLQRLHPHVHRALCQAGPATKAGDPASYCRGVWHTTISAGRPPKTLRTGLGSRCAPSTGSSMPATPGPRSSRHDECHDRAGAGCGSFVEIVSA